MAEDWLCLQIKAWILAVVILARLADLLSTHLVIRSQRGRERNPIVRLLGWRWWIVANIIAIPIAAVQPLFFWPLVTFSAVATVWNLSLLRKRC